LFSRHVVFDDFSNLLVEPFHIVGTRFNEQLSGMFTEFPPQKIKTIINVRDTCLFL